MTITIIGTSHIAKDSVSTVTKAVREGHEQIIAVELDRQRLHALEQGITGRPRLADMPHIGVSGFLFALVGHWAQKKLGNVVGVSPGSDMLAAVKEARSQGKGIALIDRNIQITLKRFSQLFGWKEKLKMVWDIVVQTLSLKKMPFDIRKVPQDELIGKLLYEIRTSYPGLYTALIHERNVFMARRLQKLQADHPETDIIAIVGAGHKKGIEEILGKDEPREMTFSYSI